MCGSQSDDTFHIRRSGHGRADRSILLFCITFFLCKSFLIGAVLSSTDAASVFSILRGKHLNLRDGTASLLEIESGSNDPMSYLLTTIGISLLGNADIGKYSADDLYAVSIGYLSRSGSSTDRNRTFDKDEFYSGGIRDDLCHCDRDRLLWSGRADRGNSYLSVYLLGILLGNSRIRNKNIPIPFFDGVTGLAQILIFLPVRTAGIST